MLYLSILLGFLEESCFFALKAKNGALISYGEPQLTFVISSTMQTINNQTGLIEVGILGREVR